MGTEAEKAHRAKYEQNQLGVEAALPKLYKGVSQAQGDKNLQNWLAARGQNPTGPIYKQYYSEGPFAIYGPSWDPGYKYDFDANQKIPWQSDPSQTWYDPSVAENWRDVDPFEMSKIDSFFDWRSNAGAGANAAYGGNSLAAFLDLRSKSDKPNQPGMAWWDEGNKGGWTGAPTGTPGGIGAPGGEVRSNPNPQGGDFWDWFYTNPGQNIQQFPNLAADQLGDVKGFDAGKWDTAFNNQAVPVPGNPDYTYNQQSREFSNTGTGVKYGPDNPIPDHPRHFSGWEKTQPNLQKYDPFAGMFSGASRPFNSTPSHLETAQKPSVSWGQVNQTQPWAPSPLTTSQAPGLAIGQPAGFAQYESGLGTAPMPKAPGKKKYRQEAKPGLFTY